MKKLTILLIAVAVLSGCTKANKALWGSDSKPTEDMPHAFYRVSCCLDNNNGVLTYPTFLPTNQIQLCQSVKLACRQAHCQISGATYLAMDVDCGHGFDQLGDQYYVGKGY